MPGLDKVSEESNLCSYFAVTTSNFVRQGFPRRLIFTLKYVKRDWYLFDFPSRGNCSLFAPSDRDILVQDKTTRSSNITPNNA